MYSPVPATSKNAASGPVTVSAFVPSPSSVTATSATLIRVAVLVFSAIASIWLFSVTPVGAWFGTADGA